VARNHLLDPQERAERTLTRKLRESILAWRLARAYSKDDILALYLNQTYYGHLAYGVDAAAQTYFGKHAAELDLAESALLAGLPQAPSLYDPLTDPQAAADRQAIVLDLMVKQGYITAEDARLAKSEKPKFASTPFPIGAPHFVFYVWDLLERKYPPEVLHSGLTVTTTVDLDLIHLATDLAARHLKTLANDPLGIPHGASGAALVALDPRTGEILAMVGSPDYFNAEASGAINLAVAPRQPGSAIKPITYAAAFSPDLCPDLGSAIRNSQSAMDCPWTPATMILDVRRSFVTKEGYSYVPQNYDRQYHGPVLAREALASSLNIPAVVALDHVGLRTMIRLAGRMGLTTLSDADRFGLALTLGGGEVRLLDLASAYAVFANGGRRVEPVAILEVTNAKGETIERRPDPGPLLQGEGEQVLDPRVAYLISDILSDNQARAATFGLNSILQIGRPAAVKTGTTTDYHDNWIVGYTPQLAVGVWVGNADNTPMVKISGVSGAGPIWHDFMRAALQARPPQSFVEPPGLTRVEVCALSGLLPSPSAPCPYRVGEIFIAGTEPAQTDNLYQRFKIDTTTGQLADANTPPNRVVEKIFLVLPPEAESWARQAGIPRPPRQRAGAQASGEAGEIVVTSPDPKTVYHITPLLPEASQQIRLSAMSGVALVRLTFVLDGQPLATLDASPFETWWQLAAGDHTLQVVGEDAAGKKYRSEAIGFSVRN
ncbi:MAG: transglycosylase domain-containing protein, partial [Chloroflexi bacterium]|nr:transglycosylase domain-containing protein [Chloroflexota bacterium]